MNMTELLAEVTFAAINYIVISSISNSSNAKIVSDLKLDLRTTKEDLLAEIKDTKSSLLEQIKDNRNEIENVAVKQQEKKFLQFQTFLPLIHSPPVEESPHG